MCLRLYEVLLAAEVEDFKQRAAIMGAKVVDDEIASQLQDDAIKRDQDPLFDFPNDVIYFSEEQCDQQIKYWSKVKKLKPDIPRHVIWDQRRKDACLGKFGIVAKRCSMNNDLWEMYLQNPEIALETVKKRIKFDIVRSKLYPLGYSADQPPPGWYIEKLKKEGKYTLIIDELRSLTKT